MPVKTRRIRTWSAITWTVVGLLISIVIVFALLRFATDVPLIISGEPAEAGSFEERYVRNPVLAYLHVVPGLVYLLCAPLQLSRRFRNRHLALHRRLGRVLIVAGLTSGVFALAFGIPFAFGGSWQSAATVVFGSYFVLCLCLAYAAIRRRDIRMHRRWMIRAFAVGLAVGTIRVWVGIFMGLGILEFGQSFAAAFWLAFCMHAAAAELWLVWRPDAGGRRRQAVRLAPES